MRWPLTLARVYRTPAREALLAIEVYRWSPRRAGYWRVLRLPIP